MKKLIQYSLVAIGILSLSVPATQAADPATPPPATNVAPRPFRPHHPLRAMMIRRRLAQKLGLTANQIQLLREARINAVNNVKALRADTTLTPEQRRQRVREIVKSAREQMRGILTPEQLTTLQELRAAHRHKVGA